MAKITEENYVSLEDLMQLLNSSESTIRRDLGELEQEGRLHRVHGGAELFYSLQEELSNQEKSVKNSHIKKAIAQRASQLIYDNDVIFIDAGTTTEFLLPFLQAKNLTVVTNSIHHAARLVELSIETIIVGGYVKQTTDASIGNVALEQIRQMNFDKAFLGMNGVDDSYLTTPDMEEAVIKKAVLSNAKLAYILVDGTKIGQVSFVKVAPINDVTIITLGGSASILKQIKEKAKVIEL